MPEAYESSWPSSRRVSESLGIPRGQTAGVSRMTFAVRVAILVTTLVGVAASHRSPSPGSPCLWTCVEASGGTRTASYSVLEDGSVDGVLTIVASGDGGDSLTCVYDWTGPPLVRPAPLGFLFAPGTDWSSNAQRSMRSV
jgi:hypothetical protein